MLNIRYARVLCSIGRAQPPHVSPLREKCYYCVLTSFASRLGGEGGILGTGLSKVFVTNIPKGGLSFEILTKQWKMCVLKIIIFKKVNAPPIPRLFYREVNIPLIV
jgi:hypothetical protein